MAGSHPADPGSSPGLGILFGCFLFGCKDYLGSGDRENVVPIVRNRSSMMWRCERMGGAM